MAYADELKLIAIAVALQEQNIGRLYFAYEIYMSLVVDKNPPSTYADGSVVMAAEGATKQLLEAVRAVIGLPPEA